VSFLRWFDRVRQKRGDFFVSFETIKALDSRKVIFKCDKLDRRLQRAIKDAPRTPRPRESLRLFPK